MSLLAIIGLISTAVMSWLPPAIALAMSQPLPGPIISAFAPGRIAYAMRPGAKALIIGPGGGWDIARAIAGGSQDITAVEINPIIANNDMRRRFPGDSH